MRDRFVRVIGKEDVGARAEQMREKKERIEFLRALAIGAAVQQTAELFLAKEDADPGGRV